MTPGRNFRFYNNEQMNYHPITLRPYQLTIGRAVLDSVRRRRGLTFTVDIARQGGKNELSAHLELELPADSA